MMAVEVRPASAGPETRRSPAADRRALSADNEPRTLAARKAYPEEPASPKPEPEEDDAPLDLTVRKEISVRDFARHSFADPSDYVRTQMILRQSQDYLASGRDSGTESDDSTGRLSPGDDAISGKAYKKSLMKRYRFGEITEIANCLRATETPAAHSAVPIVASVVRIHTQNTYTESAARAH
ncbi:hypothetical protein SFRURICE_004866 [Spodoptera frugiperda]|uniref:SFRICE_039290 n=1 Tax=Spodoptera frugiperda TaxID=7108 RepID=A0A2H1VT17_SPOFR|nr:hypothetical protein SFRURICE_004866 [Spodoptera frugiperda]